MGAIVAFVNQKGGACKTTTTAAFASCLSRSGRKVLCIDTDQQGSLSFLLGANSERPGAFELFTSAVRRPDARPFIQETALCDLISADERLVGAELSMMREVAREKRLAFALESVKSDYDFILIDTPPAISVTMLNALVAADHLIIPTNASVLHAAGMKKLFETIESVRATCNPNLEVAGVVVTMHRKVKGHEEMNEVLARIADNAPFPVSVFDARIPMSVVVEDAQKAGVDLLGYRSPASAPAVAAYVSLVEEYLAKTGRC